MQAVLRTAAGALIVAYQRYLSPHKGFCCAHRKLRGGASCSRWIHRIVREQPPRRWLPLAARRFAACGAAAVELRRRGGPGRQDGFCCVIPVRCDLGLLRPPAAGRRR